MNRKGFAITTIIYGLSVLGVMVVFILMGILSSTRSNVSSEATRVEEELINFSKSNIVYTYSDSPQEFSVPKGESGWFRIEVFGAPATGRIGEKDVTARGAYVTGIIEVEEGDKFIIKFESDATIVRNDDYLIASAANGSISGSFIRPGGTLLGQCGEVPGGQINANFSLDSSQLTFNGSQDDSGHGVLYGDACADDKYSYLAGYPGLPIYDPDDPKYFVDGFMLAGVSNEAKVIITNLTNKDASIETIPRKNEKFDNVESISVNYDDDEGCKAHIIKKVSYTVAGYSFSCDSCENQSSCTCDFGATNIDDISIIFEQPKDNDTFINRNISCYNVGLKKKDSTDYQIIYNSDANSGIPWTPTGIKLSAYQPDYYSDPYNNGNSLPPHGNYYIFPITNEAKALSAKALAQDDGEELQVEYLNGESRQKWSIDVVNFGKEKGEPSKYKPIFRNLHNRCIYNGKLNNCYNEYRLLELSRFKALSIYYDENRIKNGVSTHETFNSLSRNDPQLWNIFSVGDGTYAIRTTVTSFDPANRTGFLLANTTPGSDRLDSVYIGYGSNSKALLYNPEEPYKYTECEDGDCDNDLKYTNVERFYLYSLDFSS